MNAMFANNDPPNVSWTSQHSLEPLSLGADLTLELRRGEQVIVQVMIPGPCAVEKIGAWTRPINNQKATS